MYDETPDGEPQGWQIFTLNDAYLEREPTQWIVDRYFSTETINIVYGPPASMKSMLLADMCLATISGRDWLPGSQPNNKGINTFQCPALWIDIDNGSRRTHERFAALGKARNLPPDAPFYYVSMPMPPLNANKLDSTLYLIDVIRNCGARLVIIDNLGLITGDVEENSAEMANVMGYLRLIAERTKSALVIVHHQRKGGANGGRSGDALRGHSSIEAAVDLALNVMRDPDTGIVSIQSTKTRGVDVPPAMAVFNYTHHAGTHDLETAWFSGKERMRGENNIKTTILEIVAEAGQITKTRLATLTRDRLEGQVGVNNVRGWIDDMLNITGELVTEKGRDNAAIICLP
jgi:hypothetical protein